MKNWGFFLPTSLTYRLGTRSSPLLLDAKAPCAVLGLGVCSVPAAPRLWGLFWGLHCRISSVKAQLSRSECINKNIWGHTWPMCTSSPLSHTLPCPCNPEIPSKPREEKQTAAVPSHLEPRLHSGFGWSLWKGNPASPATWQLPEHLCKQSPVAKAVSPGAQGQPAKSQSQGSRVPLLCTGSGSRRC